MKRFLMNVARAFTKSRKAQPAARPGRLPRPAVEALEDRLVPSTIAHVPLQAPHAGDTGGVKGVPVALAANVGTVKHVLPPVHSGTGGHGGQVLHHASGVGGGSAAHHMNPLYFLTEGGGKTPNDPHAGFTSVAYVHVG
jgi:hypothetical protein